ncbi:hypothetical protein CRG98_003741 [Punica granatum]|uniref:Uncharacterized protein n=1 Tax=Punica granatum TaxID=22663 RepID=A0A2I0L6U3_PUNGR|nr:hypothetical protein CRG98_003741 [Punica granatum]
MLGCKGCTFWCARTHGGARAGKRGTRAERWSARACALGRLACGCARRQGVRAGKWARGCERGRAAAHAAPGVLFT